VRKHGFYCYQSGQILPAIVTSSYGCLDMHAMQDDILELFC
jgi:hypothetical protein